MPAIARLRLLKIITMAKKRNKSRLCKKDVDTICQMQRTIDSYESYLTGLMYFAMHGKEGSKPIVLLRGTDMDHVVNSAFENINRLHDTIEQQQEAIEKLREQPTVAREPGKEKNKTENI